MDQIDAHFARGERRRSCRSAHSLPSALMRERACMGVARGKVGVSTPGRAKPGNVARPPHGGWAASRCPSRPRHSFARASQSLCQCSRRWMGGRVVEGTGLENRQAGNRLVGSNPTPSASYAEKRQNFAISIWATRPLVRPSWPDGAGPSGRFSLRLYPVEAPAFDQQCQPLRDSFGDREWVEPCVNICGGTFRPPPC